MDEAIIALAEQNAELRALLEPLTEPDWKRPTPCEGWDVADVVLHLAQTNEYAIASARGELDGVRALAGGGAPGATVDDGAAAMVELQRGATPATVFARWLASTETFDGIVRADDLHRRVTWVAGQLTLRTLVSTRLAETWIHTGDVAAALGYRLEPTDRLRHIARLAWRTLPYAFERSGQTLHGPVAFELRSPAGGQWDFAPDEPAVTTVRGDAHDLCLVAARRVDPAVTSLDARGPDADAVLALVRTYA
jgi:uncharacterized protein (TIGR03084 family)